MWNCGYIKGLYFQKKMPLRYEGPAEGVEKVKHDNNENDLQNPIHHMYVNNV